MGLDLICCCAWPIVKSLLCVWMYHPTYRGALFIQALAQPHIEKYYELISIAAGKYLAFLGLPTRVAEKAENPKKEN